MAIADLYDKLNVNIFLLGHQQGQADSCCKIWLETAACNCSHPQQPSVFLKKTWRRSFAQVLGPSCLVGILSVPGSSPGDAFATPISPAPRLELSSRCLRCPEDVTWPTPEKFLPFLFSKMAIVFYYRCLKIALLSCHGSVFFFPTPPPSLPPANSHILIQ